jgi:hypothetical protein
MDALESELKAVEASLAGSREKLTAEAASIEAQVSSKLDAGLKGLDTSVASALSQSREEVEKKMLGDVASLRSEVADAKGASEAAGDKLHDKVQAFTTATQARVAAQEAQVATVAKAHADFEAHATTTLARVKDSLSTTKVHPVCLPRSCVACLDGVLGKACFLGKAWRVLMPCARLCKC